MKNNFYLVLVLSLLLLSGCAEKNLSQGNVYTILPEWQNDDKPTENSTVTILKLAPMRAIQALESTQLLYSDARYVINSYAYSQWNDQPGTLLLTRIQIALEHSNLFKAVVPPTSSATADLLLESTLLDFSHHLKEGERSEGVIRIRFYLIDNSTKVITSTREFSAKIPAHPNNAQGAVKALNEATTVVVSQLINWLTELGVSSPSLLKTGGTYSPF